MANQNFKVVKVTLAIVAPGAREDLLDVGVVSLLTLAHDAAREESLLFHLISLCRPSLDVLVVRIPDSWIRYKSERVSGVECGLSELEHRRACEAARHIDVQLAAKINHADSAPAQFTLLVESWGRWQIQMSG